MKMLIGPKKALKETNVLHLHPAHVELQMCKKDAEDIKDKIVLKLPTECIMEKWCMHMTNILGKF